jgi:THO complex subunit 1
LVIFRDAYALTTGQTDWLKETETQVYKLLDETPPNGKKFSKSVQHMLSREELWNSWKNEGCKDFKRPEQSALSDTEVEGGSAPRPKKPRKLLGDQIWDYNKQGKFYMGK